MLSGKGEALQLLSRGPRGSRSAYPIAGRSGPQLQSQGRCGTCRAPGQVVTLRSLALNDSSGFPRQEQLLLLLLLVSLLEVAPPCQPSHPSGA